MNYIPDVVLILASIAVLIALRKTNRKNAGKASSGSSSTLAETIRHVISERQK